ncbi:MAG: serine/threonine protein kinase [Deltaproteobacteria bacterium]|nr:serine/threonine protein kinase [Deltaproteobacteria bacterium]
MARSDDRTASELIAARARQALGGDHDETVTGLAPLTLASGVVVGNYTITRRLAKGGMGDLFLATQRGPDGFSRTVVLKMLSPQHLENAEFVAMFLNEARIAANLSHPNIVHIYQFLREAGAYLIAMEYVRGASVLELLRGRMRTGSAGLPYGCVVRIAAAVCDALDYAYNDLDATGAPRHVIHRDISPSNVLVGYEGQIKLVDFGIAKALESESVTKATTIKGKFGYLSPEQVRCHPLDQRSDLFAVGTMMWEMSVGERLFRRDNELQMMNAILNEPIPAPSSRVPAYPPGLETIVMRALAREVDDRYPSAAAVAEELRALARAQQWDDEPSTLSRIVKTLVPEDAGPPAQARAMSQSEVGWEEAELASTHSISMVEDEAEDEDEDEAAPDAPDLGAAPRATGSSRMARVAPLGPQPRLTRANWITLACCVIATAVFWALIVPGL